MTQVILQLGNFVFQDFEIPESISLGGEQMLVTHKFPGGARVIDAMGPDDDAIEWSGRFRGAAAESRMRQLDLMRQQGQALTLTWGTLIYVVLIKSFKPHYLTPWEITYSISCEVLTDPTLPQAQQIETAAAAFTADMNAANTIATAQLAAFTQLASSVALVLAAVQETAGLAIASSSSVAVIRAALATAQAAQLAASAIVNKQISISGVAGVVTGAAPASAAAGLLATSNALTQANSLCNLGSLLGRMSDNLANIGN
jgi:hypothetical protein